MSLDASTIRAFEDMQWLRRFAQRLAADSDDAEGLVQETLVEAWRDPPPDADRSVRPWLASVFRNRLRMARRGRQRRERREHAYGRTQEAGAVDDAHERLEVLSVLLAELRTLPEDDREIVVRRFFEGETPAEIGRRRQIPAATVRSKLHRSLARLRRSLDAKFGDRKTWGAAVLAFDGAGATPAPSAASPPTMSLTAKLLVAATVVALSTGAWVYARSAPPPSAGDAPSSAAAPAPVPSAAEPDDLAARTAWNERRDRIRSALAVDPAPAPAPAPDETSAQSAAREYRDLVRACMDDLGSTEVGALTISFHEIGAPDVGSIYDSVQVVHTNFDDAETLECLVQSMYAYVGEAPAEPFERVRQRTMALGEAETVDEAGKQVVGYIAGAHAGEVRFCASKAEADVAGTIAYTIAIGEGGVVDRATAGPTDLPEPVVACITAAIERWRFPERVAGQTFSHGFSLPVAGERPGP